VRDNLVLKITIAEPFVHSSVLSKNNSFAVVVPTGQMCLSRTERLALAVGIVEIPLGIDKYFLYAEEHAQWGALGGFNFSLTTLSLIYLYLRWAGRIIGRELPHPKVMFGLPQLVYLAVVALSVLAAQVRLLAMFDLFLLLQAYALFFYIANRSRTIDDLVFIIRCLSIGLAIQGLIMIGLRSLGEAAYGMSSDFMLVNFEVQDDGRTAGTLHSPVLAGSWLAMVWLVVLPLFLVERNSRMRLFHAGCLSIGLLGILFTQTRGAVLTIGVGTLLMGAAMLFRGWLPRWVIKFIALAVLLAVLPLVSIVQKRMLQGDGGSAESRRHLTLIAFETISRNPLWGYGSGNCHLACLPVANTAEYRSEWYYTIHCKYLLVWIENGIVGLLAFLALLFNGIRHGLVSWLRKHPVLSPLGLGFLAAVSGHMVHMLVDVFNSRPQVQTLWLVLGIVALIYRQSTNERPLPNRAGRLTA
jgi:O-antigen ligase